MDIHSNWRRDFETLGGPIAAELVRQYNGEPDARPPTDEDRETVAQLTVAQVTALHQEANREAREQLKVRLCNLVETWRDEADKINSIGAPHTISDTYRKCISGIEAIVKQSFE